MKLLKLTQGKFSLVDDEDFDNFNKFKWCACWNPSPKSFYARRSIYPGNNKQLSIFLHREIMKAPKGMDVDHINHDGLDNRKENLRVCTRSQNMGNRSSLSSNNKTGFRGVHWNKFLRKWRAIIEANGNRIDLGVFSEKTKAAKAYEEANKKYFGEFGGALIALRSEVGSKQKHELSNRH